MKKTVYLLRYLEEKKIRAVVLAFRNLKVHGRVAEFILRERHVGNSTKAFRLLVLYIAADCGKQSWFIEFGFV